MPSIIEAIAHGNKEAHDIYTGQGLISEEKKSDKKGREIMDAVNQQAERLRSAANEYADSARELVREHLEEQTTTENLKQYIGEKLEGLKESILHGDHEAHEIHTGHGLMELDDNTPETVLEADGGNAQ